MPVSHITGAFISLEVKYMVILIDCWFIYNTHKQYMFIKHLQYIQYIYYRYKILEYVYIYIILCLYQLLPFLLEWFFLEWR